MRRVKHPPSAHRSSSRFAAAFDRVGLDLGEACVWVLLLALWWVHDVSMKDAFRLPKQLVAQPLALASLFFLSWRLAAAPSLDPRRLARLPVLRAVVPMLLVASAGLLTSAHPHHVAEGLISLWIGAAAWVGWNQGLPSHRLGRLVDATVLPATALALVGVLQFHGLYRPFDFAGETEGQRLGVTSFAGSAGDLAMFLVLPVLVAQVRLRTARGRRRVLWGAALLVCLWALVVSQTLSALMAVVLASALLWWPLLPRRRALAALALSVLVATVALAVVPPLRERVASKVKELGRGDVNSMLTGRLDGWRAALYMVGEHPLAGVGHGAYRTEFAGAKLTLSEHGVEFFHDNRQVMFVNAHNEYLEAAAEWGLPGAAALAWALWVVVSSLRRRSADSAWSPEDRALAWAGLAALAILSLAQFPFRLALVGYEAVLFLAWIVPREAP